MMREEEKGCLGATEDVRKNIRIDVSPLPPDGRYDIVREWTTYAEEPGRNLFFKFFCYFLAFNHLYDSRELWNRDVLNRYCKDRKGIPDLVKLRAFLEYVFLDDDGTCLDVRVSKEEYELLDTVEWRDPVTHHWRKDNPLEFRDLKRSGDDRHKTMVALSKVYRVRCNLFHGDKHVTVKRDRDLVEKSSTLLGRFLQACMQAHLGMEHLHIESNGNANGANDFGSGEEE